LIPDWTRIRHLVAKQVRKSEDDVQAMAESADSLDRVELVAAVEELLGVRLPGNDG